MTMTNSQKAALKWLREHNGEGTFERSNHCVLVAAGERAPFTRSTWNRLRDLGLVAIRDHRVVCLV
jgi:hypothetical protein